MHKNDMTPHRGSEIDWESQRLTRSHAHKGISKRNIHLASEH